MALTTNKKNKIIAEWKAGVHKSYNSIATMYKIDPKTVKKLLDGINQSNAEIVEVGTMYEMAKKSIKNPNEIKAIEVAIQKKLTIEDYKDKVHETTLSIIDGVSQLLKKGKAQKVTTASIGDGIVEANIIETDLQSIDYKNLIDTIDKASITLKVNDRFAPKIEIKQDNNNAIQNNITIEDISKAIADGLPN